MPFIKNLTSDHGAIDLLGVLVKKLKVVGTLKTISHNADKTVPK